MKLLTLSIGSILALAHASCEKSGPATNRGDESSKVASHSETKHEELADQIMDSMADVAAAISTASDFESANQAAATIRKTGDRFSEIVEELKALDPPTDEVKEKIDQKMEVRNAEMQQTMGAGLQTTMQKLDPEARLVLQNSFEDFFRKMDSAGKEFERHFKVEDESANSPEPLQ